MKGTYVYNEKYAPKSHGDLGGGGGGGERYRIVRGAKMNKNEK